MNRTNPDGTKTIADQVTILAGDLVYLNTIQYQTDAQGNYQLDANGQQISDKARETIWKRIRSTLKDISPNNILLVNSQQLYELGLSNRKTECIKELAKAIIAKKIDDEKFQTLSNEKI